MVWVQGAVRQHIVVRFIQVNAIPVIRYIIIGDIAMFRIIQIYSCPAPVSRTFNRKSTYVHVIRGYFKDMLVWI